MSVDLTANSVIGVTLPALLSISAQFQQRWQQVVPNHYGGDYLTGYQQTLSQIDSSTGAVNTITMPGYPQTLTFSSDGTRAYAPFAANATCTGGNCLAVIDTAAMTTTWITVPAISRTMVISADNRYVYATASDNTLMVVDTATASVTSIPLTGGVHGIPAGGGPDSKTAYAVTGSGEFSNYQWQRPFTGDHRPHKPRRHGNPVGRQSKSMALSPDGTFVYFQRQRPGHGPQRSGVDRYRHQYRDPNPH